MHIARARARSMVHFQLAFSVLFHDYGKAHLLLDFSGDDR